MAQNFELSVNKEKNMSVLTVMTPLEANLRQPFAEMTDKMLETDCNNLVLDLTRIDRIFSLFIGTIVDLHHRSKEDKKQLIVAVNPKLGKFFEMLSMASVLNIKVVNPNKK